VSKISELSDGGSLVSSDYLIAVRSGGNVKVRMDQINVDQVDLGDNEFIRLGNSQDLTMVHTSTQSIINQAGIGDLLLQKAGATKLTINASGIDVTGTVTADGLTVTGTNANLTLGTSGNDITFARNADNYISASGGSSSNIVLNPQNRLVVSTAAAERMRIDSSGNVGIGTATTNAVRLTATTATANHIGLIVENSNAADSFGMVVKAGNDANDYTADFRKRDNTTIMRIRGDGNVGIGTSSLITSLTLGTGTTGLSFQSSATTLNSGKIAVIKPVELGNGNGHLVFETYEGGSGGGERMRLDASGNLLVGKTTLDGTGSRGLELRADGLLLASKAGQPMSLDRTGSDGTIAGFYKDGAGVGSIGVNAGSIAFGQSNTGLGAFNTDRLLFPATSSGAVQDNAIDLGYSNGRFKDLYLSGTAKSQAVQLEDIKAKDTSGLNLQTSDGQKRVILNNSGNLLVGGTSASQVAKLALLNGSATTALLTLECTHTTPYGAVQFVNGNGVAGSISVYTTSVTYNTSSDQRLKENIVDAPSASDDIDAIQVRSFDWKADGSHQKYGMVAQELQTVAPEAVSGDPDSDEMMGVDYSKLVPMMLKEIQSLRARIAALES
jgi:hypothetical protein